MVRYTHTAKPGKRKELVELLKGWAEYPGASGRVLTPGYANWDTAQLELEFETREDRDRFMAGVDWSQPRIAEFVEKISDLRESGGSTTVVWETQ